MKRITKRVVATAAAAMMTSMSLVGCMPSAKEETTEATKAQETENATGAATEAAEETILEVNTTDPIELRFNWWGGDARNEKTLNAIQKFEEKYPNIKVTPEYESFSGHEEKLALAIKSGNAPDVMQLDYTWVNDYSPNGDNFYDLNKLSNIIDLNNFDQNSLDTFTINGKLQALPVSRTGRAFGWNIKTFEEVGIDYPTTAEELLAAGQAFKAHGEDYYPLMLLDLDRAFFLRYYIESKYDKNWIEDGQFNVTKEELTDGFDYLKTLEENHVIPTDEKLAGDGAENIETNANWIAGKYAGIYLYDTSLRNKFKAVTDSDYAVGDYIELGDYHGSELKSSMEFAIAANTQHPAEAAALVQFLLADSEAVQILGTDRGIPANKAAIEALDFTGDKVKEANDKLTAWTDRPLDFVFERQSFTGSDGALTRALQESSYGQKSSEDCAQDVIDAMAKELAK